MQIKEATRAQPIAPPNKVRGGETEETVPRGRTQTITPSLSISHPNARPTRTKMALKSPTSFHSGFLFTMCFNAIKDQPWVRRPSRPLPQNPKGPDPGSTAPSMMGWAIHCQLSIPRMTPFMISLTRDTSKSSSSTLDNPRRLKCKRNSYYKIGRQRSHLVQGGECYLGHLPDKGHYNKGKKDLC